MTDERFHLLIDEMQSLTETAGGNPCQIVTQKLDTVHPKSVVGSGKLDEIKRVIEIEEIDLVIVLNRISPSSNQFLEKELEVRVIDRVQLILDIFAQRAQSQAGKLQVQLAQYQYLLPRIIGQGTQLSRLGAGIGTRGPGETQLETDRRVIRQQISQTKRQLEQLASHRERARERRLQSQQFNIGLVGYTNAGKSTLLSQLSDSHTYVQDQLFATLDPLTRQFSINGFDQFTITDTVGFIDELPTELIYAFKSTLEEIRYVDLLIHVVDASHASRLLQEETVMILLKELEMDMIPLLTVYNKMDKVSTDFVATKHPYVTLSAYNSQDIDYLKESIWQIAIDQFESYTEVIPSDQGDRLAQLRLTTLVEHIEFDPTNLSYVVKGYKKRGYKGEEK